jgi:hypothetical protein
MAGLVYEDFKVLRLKFSADCLHGHHVFFKPHSVRAEEPTKPKDRSGSCSFSILTHRP